MAYKVIGIYVKAIFRDERGFDFLNEMQCQSNRKMYVIENTDGEDRSTNYYF